MCIKGISFEKCIVSVLLSKQARSALQGIRQQDWDMNTLMKYNDDEEWWKQTSHKPYWPHVLHSLRCNIQRVTRERCSNFQLCEVNRALNRALTPTPFFFQRRQYFQTLQWFVSVTYIQRIPFLFAIVRCSVSVHCLSTVRPIYLFLWVTSISGPI